MEPDGRFAGYLAALKRHYETVMQEGVCLFPDGAERRADRLDG